MSIQASRTIAGVILAAIVIVLFWYMKRDASYVAVASFEECVKAGYQVIQTSPEQCRTPDGSSYTRAASAPTSTATSTGISSFPADNSDLIRAVNVSPNQQITSPLTVRGEARGNWYFEASFPMELRDGNGKLIVQAPAQAIGEWMTAEFVPFSSTLTFAKPSTATGTLILHNDNPSGLPENDRWISIPVQF